MSLLMKARVFLRSEECLPLSTDSPDCLGVPSTLSRYVGGRETEAVAVDGVQLFSFLQENISLEQTLNGQGFCCSCCSYI